MRRKWITGGGNRPRPLLFSVLLCGAALLPTAACAQTRCAIQPAKEPVPLSDPRLRLLAGEQPDSVVGVLLRTTRELTAKDRAALETCGFELGSVVGDIVTGRVRAGAAEQLARHPLVAYMELARNVRIPPPLPRPEGARPESTRPPR